ncbi:MAG: P63C domain-containing protein [Rhodospirillaceae bacterium]
MSPILVTTVKDDSEPRVRDVELAERLEYANVKNFREIIRSNERYLNKINVLRVAPLNPDPVLGGRPGKEYWLTEAQAIFIIGQSGTPKAKEISVEIAIAFVEYRRQTFDVRLYGAIARDMLLPAPRHWEREFDERFWTNLHRVGGWKRPAGNNHSNCAHFINRYIYEYLLGRLGLTALRDANPRGDAGDRTHCHHQLLKDKHLTRLRQHIAVITGLLTNAVSLKHFADQFARAFPDANLQLGLLFFDESPALAPSGSQSPDSASRSFALPSA